MDAKTLGNQPAHPSSSGHQDPRNLGWIGDGLTKRELFAAMAMQALLPTIREEKDLTALFEMSVRAADRLLEVLAKDTKE